MKISKCLPSEGEKGSAIMEFVLFGLVAQIAILIFALDLLGHQKLQMAVETAARQAARNAALPGGSFVGVDAIEKQQSRNFDLAPGRLNLELSPSQPTAGDLVTATASIDGVTAKASMRVPR
jgi:hypothetical protein